MSESMAKFSGGKYMGVRFPDLMGWGKKTVTETRSAEEIKKHIMDKINGRCDVDAEQ